MAEEKETLPYNLKTLSWDAMHHFNANNKYSYSGKGRKLGDPVLQCDVCEQWFLLKEVACVPKEANFVPFQRNYRFSCRVCTNGPEQFELQTNTWTSIVLTAMYNLLLADDGSSLRAGEYIKVADIVTWIQEHWGSLTSGRNLSQLLENAAVPKCLAYAQNAQTFTFSDDRSEVLLKHVAPSKLLLKPHVSSAVPGIVPVKKGNAPKVEPADKGKKRGRGAKGKDAAANKEAKAAAPSAPPAPSLTDIKLPEKYRLLPVPKVDTSAPQDSDIVQLSRSSRAPQLGLKEDRNGVARTVTGYKGYRMVRATHGVASGAWYFEVKILEPMNGEEDGHTRIGWCTESGDLNAPVGYDINSYSYRDVNGTKFHESRGGEYGDAYGPGDVIGCLLKMGDPPAARRERQRISLKGVEYIVEEERSREESIGSQIAFFRNGKAQGVAYENVWAEVYYPAVSLYKAATVEVNFGPDFLHPPPSEHDARPCCELAAAEKETLAAAAAARPNSAAAAAAAGGGGGSALFGDPAQTAAAAAAEAGAAAAGGDDDDAEDEGEDGDDEEENMEVDS